MKVAVQVSGLTQVASGQLRAVRLMHFAAAAGRQVRIWELAQCSRDGARVQAELLAEHGEIVVAGDPVT